MLGRAELGEVGLHARDYWRVLHNRWGVVLLCFALLFMVAVVITYMTPQKYAGRVLLEISRPRAEGGAVVGTGADPTAAPTSVRYIENQFDIISSKEVLGRVVDKLDLVQRWGAGTRLAAYRHLRTLLDTEQRNRTDMIDITVLHEDPEFAAELANAVAETYSERRRELFRERLMEVDESLKVKEREQEEKLAGAHARFVDAAGRLGISNVDPSYFARFGTADETGGLQQLLEKMQGEVFAAEKDLRTAESRVASITGLEGNELIRMAVPMGLKDPALADRYRQFRELQLEEIELREAGVGEQHPRRLAIVEKLAKVRAFLLESAAELKAGLEQNLEIARLAHLRLEEMYANLQERSQGARQTNQEFVAATRDYNIQLETLRRLKLKLEQQRVDGALDPHTVTTHERAEPDDQPVSPKVALNLIIGALTGMTLGIGMAFFLEYLDTSVKTVDEVEGRLGAPVLAVVPNDVAMIYEAGAGHADAEAYRILRTNIEFARGESGGNVLTFVSAAAGEGKSTTLMNFATVCAQGGYSVLVIDADLRRPRLHTLFNVRNGVGLTNYLSSDVALEDVVLRTPVDGLYFVPSGILPADGAGMLNSRRFAELIADAKSRFDLVLVDSPPILGVSDASVLASEADMTVLVVQHGKLPRQILGKAKSAIDKVGGNLLGAVLNNVDIRSDTEYQYYTSYYTYYAPEERGSAAAGSCAAARLEPAERESTF